MNNSITDVAGILVGNAHDTRLMSGVTALVFATPAVASVAVFGGAPAGRDLGCLEPDAAVGAVDAIVLSGGSGFGLDAASGAQAWMRENGRGLDVGAVRVPIVPSAICFDLANGGDKTWARYPPYRELGFAATAAATAEPVLLGTAGAGYGASTVDLKGGLGSTSAITSSGFTVAALVVVNALGSALMGAGPHFWAAPLERNGEFGDLGFPHGELAVAPTWKGRTAAPSRVPASTTIACVATDARLDKAQAKRLAIAANAGLARGLRISHALMDGDTIFAAATGTHGSTAGLSDQIEIGVLAADCLSRAIARAVFAATVPETCDGIGWLGPPAWHERFGRKAGPP
jgi:L-aminopeptidase/D-esterase-like protein